MKRTALALSICLALPAAAVASDDQRPDAATQERIRAHLTEQGYEVRKIEAEDGQFEAYVIKDGQRMEIYLNDALEIVRTKRDD